MVQPQVGIDSAHAAAAARDGVSAVASIIAKAAATPMLSVLLTAPSSIISLPLLLGYFPPTRAALPTKRCEKAPGRFQDTLELYSRVFGEANASKHLNPQAGTHEPLIAPLPESGGISAQRLRGASRTIEISVRPFHIVYPLPRL